MRRSRERLRLSLRCRPGRFRTYTRDPKPRRTVRDHLAGLSGRREIDGRAHRQHASAETPRSPAPPVSRSTPSRVLQSGRLHQGQAARSMIEDGERAGELTPGEIILDSTSGNTGIAYAMIGAARAASSRTTRIFFEPDQYNNPRQLEGAPTIRPLRRYGRRQVGAAPILSPPREPVERRWASARPQGAMVATNT